MILVSFAQAFLHAERVRSIAASGEIVAHPHRAHSIAVQISSKSVDLSASRRCLIHHQRASAQIAKDRVVRVELQVIFFLFNSRHRHVPAARVFAPLFKAPRLCSQALTMIINQAVGDILFVLHATLLDDVRTSGGTDFIAR